MPYRHERVLKLLAAAHDRIKAFAQQEADAFWLEWKAMFPEGCFTVTINREHQIEGMLWENRYYACKVPSTRLPKRMDNPQKTLPYRYIESGQCYVCRFTFKYRYFASFAELEQFVHTSSPSPTVIILLQHFRRRYLAMVAEGKPVYE